ncbi:hypothetical protein VTI28DRAFT_10424 [Corynascus sepedonium]
MRRWSCGFAKETFKPGYAPKLLSIDVSTVGAKSVQSKHVRTQPSSNPSTAGNIRLGSRGRIEELQRALDCRHRFTHSCQTPARIGQDAPFSGRRRSLISAHRLVATAWRHSHGNLRVCSKGKGRTLSEGARLMHGVL